MGFRTRIHTTKINLRNPIQLVQGRIVHIFVYFPTPFSVSISRHLHIVSASFSVSTLPIGVPSLLEDQTKTLTETGSR